MVWLLRRPRCLVGAAQDLVNTAWFDAVVDDLGISIWRNELPPPDDAIAAQDADWNKMQPCAAMSNKAKSSGVPLKVILSLVAPSSMKCVVGTNGVQDGTPYPADQKRRRPLPSKRAAYADWLVAGLKQYATSRGRVRTQFPERTALRRALQLVRVHVAGIRRHVGSHRPRHPCGLSQCEAVRFGEHAAIECGARMASTPTGTPPCNEPVRGGQSDGIWAVHGYSDGVLATPTSQMSTYWASFYAGTQTALCPSG